jgi:hypothetical protein
VHTLTRFYTLFFTPSHLSGPFRITLEFFQPLSGYALGSFRIFQDISGYFRLFQAISASLRNFFSPHLGGRPYSSPLVFICGSKPLFQFDLRVASCERPIDQEGRRRLSAVVEPPHLLQARISDLQSIFHLFFHAFFWPDKIKIRMGIIRNKFCRMLGFNVSSELSMKLSVPGILVLAGCIGTLTVSGATKAGDISYNRDIRPILSENCFTCHGPISAARKANLRLDSFEAPPRRAKIANRDCRGKQTIAKPSGAFSLRMTMTGCLRRNRRRCSSLSRRSS